MRSVFLIDFDGTIVRDDRLYVPEPWELREEDFRRLQMQSVQTCWLLAPECDRLRTANKPSVAYWNERFKIHAEKYNYPVIAHRDRHANGLKF